MKRQVLTIVLLIALGVLNTNLYAWENRLTHPAITGSALFDPNRSTIDDYVKKQLATQNGINTELRYDFPPDIEKRMTKNNKVEPTRVKTILDWLKAGSIIEDEDGNMYPLRSRHHFHDPYHNAGLDNQTDHPNWREYACTRTGFDLTGESALWWVTAGLSISKDPKVNYHDWDFARTHFHAAMTSSDKSVREEYLAQTFLDLGHILHMLEDMGVPAHTRNDFVEAHYRNVFSSLLEGDELFEKWTEEQIENNNNTLPNEWLTTSLPKVFSRLKDYWDTGLYTGQHVGNFPNSDW